MITRYFDLWITQGHTKRLVFNANQYDSGETWKFRVLDADGSPLIPTTAAIIGQKKDGHAILVNGTIGEDGRVTIVETEQMTACAGLTEFELLLNGETHGTANFTVQVEKRPGDDADLSDSDLSLIQEAVDAVATIEDLIEGHDPDEVIADAVDDWLDAHPEATTTVEDGAITSAKLNDEVKTGVFEDMTVGTSLAVMNDEGVTDNLAYKFRPTGGDAVRELDEIHGGTIAWNQLASLNASDWRVARAQFSVNGNNITLTTTSASSFKYIERKIITGHKYLFAANIIAPVVENDENYNFIYGIYNQAGGSESQTREIVAHNTTADVAVIYNVTVDDPYFRLTHTTGTIVGISATVERPQLFDLTAMFGTTVADAIYAMEQSSAGSGVAYFRSLFPNSYYAYNAGELVSVEGLSSHDTVGFNQWDEEWEVGSINITTGQDTPNSTTLREKNYTQIVPSTQYYFLLPWAHVFWYDANKNYISYTANGVTEDGNVRGKLLVSPATAYYCRFRCSGTYGTTYKNNICINISSSENGTYKPYQKHTYPLDSTLTLRGVPKWSNGLYYDGDIYRHDGSVSRRYGTRAYQSGDESLADAITDGTNTVYKLTTPTAETADPYQQYQICGGKGTEEYISETVTPVGHNTFYPVDIVSKVNKLPSDFSTLIAPTEATFKATRNYTAKQFLIIDNQLYRVTANIANGANIVPNTNVTAVTIADILTTLI